MIKTIGLVGLLQGCGTDTPVRPDTTAPAVSVSLESVREKRPEHPHSLRKYFDFNIQVEDQAAITYTKRSQAGSLEIELPERAQFSNIVTVNISYEGATLFESSPGTSNVKLTVDDLHTLLPYGGPHTLTVTAIDDAENIGENTIEVFAYSNEIVPYNFITSDLELDLELEVPQHTTMHYKKGPELSWGVQFFEESQDRDYFVSVKDNKFNSTGSGVRTLELTVNGETCLSKQYDHRANQWNTDIKKELKECLADDFPKREPIEYRYVVTTHAGQEFEETVVLRPDDKYAPKPIHDLHQRVMRRVRSKISGIGKDFLHGEFYYLPTTWRRNIRDEKRAQHSWKNWKDLQEAFEEYPGLDAVAHYAWSHEIDEACNELRESLTYVQENRVLKEDQRWQIGVYAGGTVLQHTLIVTTDTKEAEQDLQRLDRDCTRYLRELERIDGTYFDAKELRRQRIHTLNGVY